MSAHQQQTRAGSESVALGAVHPLAEEALTDQVAWGLVDAAPDGIILADEDGLILLVNRQTEELFAYDRTDLLGRSVDDLLPERFRRVHRAHRTRFRAEPRTRPMGVGQALFGRRSDGSEFPVEISLSPLHTDAGLRVVAVVRDVTDRMKAQAEAERVRASLDATSDGVFIFDAATLRFNYVNRGAIDQVGYTRDELLGMTMLHIAPHFDDARLRALLEPLVRGEATTTRFTTVHRRRDGTDVPVEILLQASDIEEGRPRAFVKVVRDISERLAGEEQVRKVEQDLRVFEDRDRIARDLHDVVIQRLFAAGMAVQAVLSRSRETESAQRLAGVVDELDETIREIRSVIFSLHRDVAPTGGLRAEILRVVSQEQLVLGFEPRLVFDGVIDGIPAAIAAQLLPTLREALSNVGRHAHASSARVTVSALDRLTLRVEDDGVGITDGVTGGHGISNATQRAAGLGGSCTVTPGPAGGTVFEWSVPLTTE